MSKTTKFILIDHGDIFKCDYLTRDNIAEWVYGDLEIIRCVDRAIANEVCENEEEMENIEDKFLWKKLENRS